MALYCPTCGQNHHEDEESSRASKAEEVRIAEIQANRDIEVARIQAKAETKTLETVETVAELQTESDVAVAEAIAPAIAESGQDSTEGDAAPVVVPIDASGSPPPEMEEESEAAPPPEVETPEHSEPKKSRGYWP
jgi:hypothetical protein